MRKPRVGAEIYNDLDDEVVNIFRILRDGRLAADLRRRLQLTPFARTELRDSYREPLDRIDAAHKMIIRSFMGFGSASMTRTHMTGFRSSSNRSEGRKRTTPATDWNHWPAAMEALTERLRGVVIENRDAVDVMSQHDGAHTLHYVDPPYVPSTRSSLHLKNGNCGHYYRHDMDDAGHRRLARSLRKLKGMVLVSGYPCELYDELYPGWQFLEKRHMADGARARTERLWFNAPAARALAQSRAQLTLDP